MIVDEAKEESRLQADILRADGDELRSWGTPTLAVNAYGAAEKIFRQYEMTNEADSCRDRIREIELSRLINELSRANTDDIAIEVVYAALALFAAPQGEASAVAVKDEPAPNHDIDDSDHGGEDEDEDYPSPSKTPAKRLPNPLPGFYRDKRTDIRDTVSYTSRGGQVILGAIVRFPYQDDETTLWRSILIVMIKDQSLSWSYSGTYSEKCATKPWIMSFGISGYDADKFLEHFDS